MNRSPNDTLHTRASGRLGIILNRCLHLSQQNAIFLCHFAFRFWTHLRKLIRYSNCTSLCPKIFHLRMNLGIYLRFWRSRTRGRVSVPSRKFPNSTISIPRPIFQNRLFCLISTNRNNWPRFHRIAFLRRAWRHRQTAPRILMPFVNYYTLWARLLHFACRLWIAPYR